MACPQEQGDSALGTTPGGHANRPEPLRFLLIGLCI